MPVERTPPTPSYARIDNKLPPDKNNLSALSQTCLLSTRSQKNSSENKNYSSLTALIGSQQTKNATSPVNPADTLPWTAQCTTPITPLSPTASLSNKNKHSSIPTSHSEETSTKKSTTTITTQSQYITTAISTATTTTVYTTTTAIASTIASLTTNTQVLYANNLNYTNCKEQLSQKRNRETRSPNKQTEELKSNKKHKPKAQNTTQTTLKEYWLGNPASSNKFALLADDDILEEQSDSGTVPNTSQQTPRIQKPPPIYVQNVENIKALADALNSIPNIFYEMKVLSKNEIKLQPKESLHYKKMIELLKQKGTKYYTFRPKEERGFKVILRNMHYSTDTEDIKQELAELGHEITNIHNIQIINSERKKQPLSLFSLELKTKDNNKEIYNITNLLHCKISFEPPRQKRIVPQCTNCQRYGHTKNYCQIDPACVKCAGKHKTIMCPIKDNNKNSIKCIHCGENHTANYRGCAIYKALQVQRYPALRKKSIQNEKEQKNNETIETNANTTRVVPGITYAQATTINTAPKEPNQTKNNIEHVPKNNDDMTELKEMMKQLITQITSMMNILTMLVTKLDERKK